MEDGDARRCWWGGVSRDAGPTKGGIIAGNYDTVLFIKTLGVRIR